MTACPACADTLTGELCRKIKRRHSIPMSSLSPQPPPSTDPPLLVLVRDLIFSTRITATAKSMGIDVKLLRDASKLAAETGLRLIVDLNQAGALDAAIAWKQQQPAEREVVGFVAHVDTETIRRARDAGIDHVLPRSKFVIELESLLRGA